MRMNLDTLRIAVEAFRLDDPNGSYKPGAAASYAYDVDTSTTIQSNYGWAPEGGDKYAYTVTPTATTYSLQAKLKPGGLPGLSATGIQQKPRFSSAATGKTGIPAASCHGVPDLGVVC